jgi:hypothetical protein
MLRFIVIYLEQLKHLTYSCLLDVILSVFLSGDNRFIQVHMAT